MPSQPLATALDPAMTSHHQDVLNDLIDVGHELARMALSQAKAGTMSVPQATSIYDRVTRSIRRNVWLVRKLAEPLKLVDRTAARKQIIRTVEDTIQRNPDPSTAATLHAEFRERLDASDLEDDIDGRRVEDIIAEICRDLGLAASPGCHPWKRRTPEDLAILHALAARPTPTVAPAKVQSGPLWPSQTHPHASDRNPPQLA